MNPSVRTDPTEPDIVRVILSNPYLSLMEAGSPLPRASRVPASHAGALDRVTAFVESVGPAFAGWLLPFALVLYLALKGGGYDPVVRGEVGIAIWWIVLLGAGVGVLPLARVPRVGW